MVIEEGARNAFMNDDDLKPYRRIKAAEDLQAQNDLLDTYVRLYKEKYRTEPIFPVDRIHFRHIKSLREMTGDNALHVLFAYFEIRDDWFSKQHHSLECLLKNINKINQFVLEKHRVRELKGKLLMRRFCDSCPKEFEFICPPTFDMDMPVRCPECEKSNRSFYRPTKEERQKALHIINSAFKEVPGGE